MNEGFLRACLGISLVSTASLTYEIGLTRLFSIAQGYHFAFMVVSIALLGIGAGGSILMASRASNRQGRNISSILATLASLLSIAIVLSFVAANRILFDPVQAAWNPLEFLKILAQYLILAIPFVFSGMVISLSIMSMSDRVHRIYLADLAGAASGCLLILYILTRSGGEAAVTLSALLALVASLLFNIPSERKERLLPILAAVVLVVATSGGDQILKAKTSPYRELAQVLNFPGAKALDTVFSPSARLDIVESPAVRAAPGISLTHLSPLPPQRGFTLNGGGLSTVTRGDGDLSFLRHLPSSLAYRFSKKGEVFVIDPGGGMEVLSALQNGASRVMGSESRGSVLGVMKDQLLEFSGGLYREADIRHGPGRQVLSELGIRFDVIALPRTDTLGSSSSGIMGLQEDYSVTVEAFSDYLSHLQEGGFLSVSAYLLPPPRHEIRLLATAVQALEAQGVERPEERIAAIRSWGVLTMMVKNGALSPNDIEAIKSFCREERFDLVWYPGMKEDEANIYNRFPAPVYHRLFRQVFGTGARDALFRDYLFDVAPATDDRPFFGHVFKLSRMKDTYRSVGEKWAVLMEGGYLLPWVLAQAAVASLVMIAAPLLFSARRREGARGLPAVAVYFAAIGMGFMFVEISLIQRLLRVLGEPTYAISAVLFAILVSTGIGSWLAGRFRIIERFSLHALLALPLLILLYQLLLPWWAGSLAGLGMTARFLLTFLFLFPLGAAMGVPFPTGMALLGEKMPGYIPWAWCINGSFSVISATAAVMVALTAGFQTVQVSAALLYVAAWGALVRMGRKAL